MSEDAKKRGYTLYVAHFNHKIRGEDAERDAEFCRAKAEEYGLSFFLGEADVPALAKQNGNSLEMEAREQRY
jgi:tRNA(Ile)-lysidine synthase